MLIPSFFSLAISLKSVLTSLSERLDVGSSITTIKQPCSQLGYLASELLIEKINNPDTEIKQVQLPTELIIRESTSQE